MDEADFEGTRVGSIEALRVPLAPRKRFLKRLGRHALLFSVPLIAGSLAVGAVGYHLLAELPWIDAILNASMILTGMGPVDPMHTTAGKLFASAYAIFSGVAFLTTVGVLLAPVVHRVLHRLHLDDLDQLEE
jgi:hypothetical protein